MTTGLRSRRRCIFVAHDRLSILPDEIEYCSKLSVLNVSANRLGALPSRVGFMRLMYLDVSNNELPTLPASLLRLDSLAYVSVSNNFLCEKALPDSVAGWLDVHQPGWRVPQVCGGL